MKKYLYYNSKNKKTAGLSDRRACLMILLAEAKLSHRIAVVPKFRLGAGHNHGNTIESYLVGVYFNINRLGVEYVLEEDFLAKKERINSHEVLNIKDDKFDYNSDKVLIQRNLEDDNFFYLNKLMDVLHLAKLYHGLGAKFVIPEVTAPENVKAIGDKILSQLEKPIVGVHLRRGDRLNKKLMDSMNPDILQNKLSPFDFNSVYIATNDLNYRIDNSKYFSYHDFKDMFSTVKDNFTLFCIEMYIVDNCDISVRTFNDSSPYFHIEDTSNKNYAIANYSMHFSQYQFKNIPNKLVKCNYEDYDKINRKTFTKPRPFLPWLISYVKTKLRIT